MFKVIPFKKEHVIPLLDQKINQSQKVHFLSEKVNDLEKMHSFTMCWNDEVLVCYGVVPIWDKRGVLWVVFSETSKFNFIPIIRATKRLLRSSEFDRVEMAIPCHFEVGHRRARLLDFTLETKIAKKYFPSGEDCTLYAWVRE